MIQSIRILGKRFAVRLVPPSTLDGDATIGSVSCSKGEIEIREGLGADEERETLLHEVLHVIEKQLGLELREQQVTALSVGLWAAAQANPEEMRWILGLDQAATS